jgi:hypothetical protein
LQPRAAFPRPASRRHRTSRAFGQGATAEKVAQAAIGTFGSIDHLVNNAGIFSAKPFTDYTSDEFDNLVSTNLKGFLFITQLAVKQILSQGTGGSVTSITASLLNRRASQRRQSDAFPDQSLRLTGDDADQAVIHRARERPAVDDQFVREFKNIWHFLRHLLLMDVTAPAQRIKKQDRTLPCIQPILGARVRSRKRRDQLLSFEELVHCVSKLPKIRQNSRHKVEAAIAFKSSSRTQQSSSPQRTRGSLAMSFMCGASSRRPYPPRPSLIDASLIGAEPSRSAIVELKNIVAHDELLLLSPLTNRQPEVPLDFSLVTT